MPQTHLAGTRIRDRRLDRGMRQTELARAVGISGSYLNLIEHNRRRIGGKLLHDIARALGADPAALAAGAGTGRIDDLRAAAAGLPEAAAEVALAEDFAGRFPGWAALVAAQAERIAVLEARTAALTDQLGHDPQLATSLHEMISAVTSIRSAASILVNGGDLDRDWQARFHGNIHADSLRLADSSQALVRYLEGAGRPGAALSPAEAAAQVLDSLDAHVPALEGDAPAATPEGIVAGLDAVGGAAGRIVLHWLRRYRADAVALPIAAFAERARALDHDPVRLAQAFGTGLAPVLRRLAALPPGQGHPPAGLAVCDGAGALLHLRTIPGFALSRTGPGCPQWPLWQALGQPGVPIRAAVELPGAAAQRFLCYAVATPRELTAFDAVPAMEAVMLVLSDPPADLRPLRPAGIGCRICPRPDCATRREDSILEPG